MPNDDISIINGLYGLITSHEQGHWATVDAISTVPSVHTSYYPVNNSSGFDTTALRDLQQTVMQLQSEVIELRRKLVARETETAQKEHRKLSV